MNCLRNALIVAVILQGTNGVHAQYLAGKDRADFIAGSTNSCLRGYGKGDTGVILRPLFEHYCQCYSTGIANRLTAAQIKAEDPATINPVIQEEGRRCYQIIKDEAIKQHQRRN